MYDRQAGIRAAFQVMDNIGDSSPPPSEAPYSFEPNGEHFLVYDAAGSTVAKVWDEQFVRFLVDMLND